MHTVADTVSDMQFLAGFCEQVLDLDAGRVRAAIGTTMTKAEEDFGAQEFRSVMTQHRDARLTEYDLLPRVGSCIQKDLLVRMEGGKTGVDGPSFDCAQVSSDAERLVCADPGLWAYDRAAAFAKRDLGLEMASVGANSGPHALCDTSACLRDAYVAQLIVTIEKEHLVRQASARPAASRKSQHPAG